MLLLEYEAKHILGQYGVPVPVGEVLRPGDTPSFFPAVLKSQVHSGGRGKAGGIKIVEDASDAAITSKALFALPIKEELPQSLLAEEKLAIEKEFYLALVINRSAACVELVAHAKGGIDVEDNSTDEFARYALHDHTPETLGQLLADVYDLPGQTFVLQDLVAQLSRCFTASDATLLEINPLVLTADDTLIAGDCKMTLDPSAAFRHPEWQFEHDPAESNFVVLDEHGTTATIANGAGLAMATVDAVSAAGLQPANFLDIGGGADAETVLAAFRRIAAFPEVRVIVINIFAGITQCDEVAKAIIAAKKHIDTLPPLCIRLAGTRFKEAAALLQEERIPLCASLEACLQQAEEIIHG